MKYKYKSKKLAITSPMLWVLVTAIIFSCGNLLVASDMNHNTLDWFQLSETQQQMLQELSTTWDKLPTERRNKILLGLEQWQAKNNEQRNKARERFVKWKALSEKQREALQEKFRSLTAE